MISIIEKKQPNELAGYLRANGITQRYVAKLIGKTEVTVHYKIFGQSQFNQQEIDILVNQLGIPLKLLFKNKRSVK